MLTFFPTPYADELLYSVFARYHMVSGNTSIKATLNDLFGSTTVTASMELPSWLRSLEDHLPIKSLYTADDLINAHTLFPLYTAFLPPERTEQIRTAMLSNDGKAIHARSGIMASSIRSSRYFRFCIECLKEQIELHGEPCWQRLFQIPGVLVCPKHRVPLHDSTVSIRGLNKHEYTPATLLNCVGHAPVAPNVTDTEMRWLLHLAEMVESVLHGQYPRRPREWFRDTYLNRLMEKGYATTSGRVDIGDLISDFTTFYGTKFLDMVQCRVDGSGGWLIDMLRTKRDRTAHPIRHLLLADFLGLSLHDLFTSHRTHKPFGSGPWVCMNGATDHYLQPVITDLTITWVEGKPVGTFTCQCGCVYSRTPETAGRVKRYGDVWDQRLRYLADRCVRLRPAARDLKVDPGTIKKHARRLGLDAWSHDDGQPSTSDSQQQGHEYREAYRKQWLDAQHDQPTLSRSYLRRLLPGAFTWLYRNDREWLDANSPRRAASIRAENNRVDWGKRDQDVLAKVQQTISELHSSETIPKRVTISLVGKRMGLCALLEKHLDKLPMTREYLGTVCDTDDGFRVRRVKWALRSLKASGYEPRAWRVKRLASLRDPTERVFI